MTALIVVLPLIVVVEISLQLHRSLLDLLHSDYMLFYFVQCWLPEDFGGVHLSLSLCAGFCSARIRVLKNSLLCCEKIGMEYYLQLIFHFCFSFFTFFLLGAFLLCSLSQNSIGILRFFFYELFSMVFPVLEEMQQKPWVTDSAYWFDQNFQQIILYLLHHPHCQELMMMKSMGSYGRLSMLFVLQVMMV
jgi:hypothetical protein